eukprot:CAMPEP_0185838790 /NCGR_PEP_ID=MMETSP1353-20130828/13581_1 /TAXON_ID=1077150 /ORGANISM="Erythrolobus australicus, Strain CCMP3124" /LENGTH=175 /DNA_ID=CAMNT_0028537879 /DNA_START=234 /DNA_END=763 /DNA_ORIENTATION=+
MSSGTYKVLETPSVALALTSLNSPRPRGDDAPTVRLLRMYMGLMLRLRTLDAAFVTTTAAVVLENSFCSAPFPAPQLLPSAATQSQLSGVFQAARQTPNPYATAESAPLLTHCVSQRRRLPSVVTHLPVHTELPLCSSGYPHGPWCGSAEIWSRIDQRSRTRQIALERLARVVAR